MVFIATMTTPAFLRAALQPLRPAPVADRSEAKCARSRALVLRSAAIRGVDAVAPARAKALTRPYGTRRHHPSRFSPHSLTTQV